MAAVDLTVEVDSTAEPTGNRSLVARFAKTAGAKRRQPFFFSSVCFIGIGDAG